LSQFTRLTDGQTDGILIARQRLHSMQRGKNKANLVVSECMHTLPCSRVY